ncbi:MAG: hypothetical protein JWO48_682 [Bryobacterales bacterium]|nr:hypothetical protein [Bryobacterales bacterium]
MSRQAVESLVDKWISDPAFRGAMRKDAEAAVRILNVDLDQDEWSAFRAVDWSLPDEELRTRLSAGGA